MGESRRHFIWTLGAVLRFGHMEKRKSISSCIFWGKFLGKGPADVQGGLSPLGRGKDGGGDERKGGCCGPGRT